MHIKIWTCVYIMYLCVSKYILYVYLIKKKFLIDINSSYKEITIIKWYFFWIILTCCNKDWLVSLLLDISLLLSIPCVRNVFTSSSCFRITSLFNLILSFSILLSFCSFSIIELDLINLLLPCYVCIIYVSVCY